MSEENVIGSRLIGMHTSIIFHNENLSSAYNKAFVAVIRDEETVKSLMDLIETDLSLYS